jgi:hypothetical protein
MKDVTKRRLKRAAVITAGLVFATAAARAYRNIPQPSNATMKKHVMGRRRKDMTIIVDGKPVPDPAAVRAMRSFKRYQARKFL